MNISNYYWYFKSAIPPKICDDIIKYGLSQSETMAKIGGYEDRELSKQEISDLVRCNRVRKTIKKINIQSLIHILKSKRTNNQIVSYIPRNDQSIIIGK